MALYARIENCFLCHSTKLETVLRLEPIPLATPVLSVPAALRNSPAVYEGVPLNLNLCLDCGQVQVSHVPNFDFEYRNYVYRTALSLNLREYYRGYAAAVIERYAPAAGKLAVEIGSNDGTLSGFFKAAGLRVLGIDPALRIAHGASEAGIETIAEFFSLKIAQDVRSTRGPAALVCANFVTANIEDMVGFAEGARTLMDHDGLLVIETQYGRDVVERNLLDTVYHEHVSYFMVKPLVAHFARHGLEVIDVERAPTKGGSIRLTAQHIGGKHSVGSRVNELLEEEKRIGAATPQFFAQLPMWIEEIRTELRGLVARERARGGVVAGWGVSVGTSALLPQFGLTRDIAFLLDDDADKDPVLRGPDYSIPVLPSSAIYERMPSLVVVFAWRYIDPIIKKHAAYLDRGGRFVVPLPHVRVVENAATGSANHIKSEKVPR